MIVPHELIVEYFENKQQYAENQFLKNFIGLFYYGEKCSEDLKHSKFYVLYFYL